MMNLLALQLVVFTSVLEQVQTTFTYHTAGGLCRQGLAVVFYIQRHVDHHLADGSLRMSNKSIDQQ